AFLAPDAAERFVRYAARAVEELGDLCDFWCTINEPNVYAIIGYIVGYFPPGRTGDIRAAVQVMGALARAHAETYRAIHRLQPQARVGWAHNFNIFDPARPRSPLDRRVAGLLDAIYNDFFPRAIRTGSAVFPFSLATGDLHAVKDPCDYVGLNVYYRDLIRFDPRRPGELFGRRSVMAGAPRSDQPVIGFWGEVYPRAI